MSFTGNFKISNIVGLDIAGGDSLASIELAACLEGTDYTAGTNFVVQGNLDNAAETARANGRLVTYVADTNLQQLSDLQSVGGLNLSWDTITANHPTGNFKTAVRVQEKRPGNSYVWGPWCGGSALTVTSGATTTTTAPTTTTTTTAAPTTTTTAAPGPVSISFTGADGTLPSTVTSEFTLAASGSAASILGNQLNFYQKAGAGANSTGWLTINSPVTFNNALTLSAKFVTLPINTSVAAADYLGLEIGTADRTSVNLQMAVYMTSPGQYGLLVIRPNGDADVSAALPGLVANEIFVLKITSPTSFSVYRGLTGTTLVGTYSMSGVTNGTTLYGRVYCHESNTVSFTNHIIDDLSLTAP